MSNYIRISTIGAQMAPVDCGLPPPRVVEEVIAYLRGRLDQVLPDKPDLVVLPELCDMPKDWPCEKWVEYALLRGNRVRDFLAETAQQHRCYITYPCVRQVEADGSWRNSIMLLDRSGNPAGVYNKNHLVIEENATAGTLYGKEPAVIQCDFGRVGCAICFDLNYDELRLQYAAARPDLMIFCSAYHGGLMQRYWAYSCRSHFVSAISGPGCPSAIVSPVGEVMASTTNYFDFVTASVNLDCFVAHLDYNWEKLRAMKARHGPNVRILDPGCLASVLVSSESSDFSAMDLAREFGIELLDDYFAHCRAHRREPGRMEP